MEGTMIDVTDESKMPGEDQAYELSFTSGKAFGKSYQRNNKKGGKKHLRCFPWCGPNHRQSNACEARLNVRLNARHKLRPRSYVLLARFLSLEEDNKTECEEDLIDKLGDLKLGQEIPASVLTKFVRTLDEPLLPFYRAEWVPGTGEADENVLDFEFREKAWHYGWKGGRYTQSKSHVLRIYLLESSEEVPVNGKLDWMDKDVTFTCVARSQSTRFTVYSSRSAPKPNNGRTDIASSSDVVVPVNSLNSKRKATTGVKREIEIYENPSSHQLHNQVVSWQQMQPQHRQEQEQELQFQQQHQQTLRTIYEPHDQVKAEPSNPAYLHRSPGPGGAAEPRGLGGAQSFSGYPQEHMGPRSEYYNVDYNPKRQRTNFPGDASHVSASSSNSPQDAFSVWGSPESNFDDSDDTDIDLQGYRDGRQMSDDLFLEGIDLLFGEAPSSQYRNQHGYNNQAPQALENELEMQPIHYEERAAPVQSLIGKGRQTHQVDQAQRPTQLPEVYQDQHQVSDHVTQHPLQDELSAKHRYARVADGQRSDDNTLYSGTGLSNEFGRDLLHEEYPVFQEAPGGPKDSRSSLPKEVPAAEEGKKDISQVEDGQNVPGAEGAKETREQPNLAELSGEGASIAGTEQSRAKETGNDHLLRGLSSSEKVDPDEEDIDDDFQICDNVATKVSSREDHQIELGERVPPAMHANVDVEEAPIVAVVVNPAPERHSTESVVRKVYRFLRERHIFGLWGLIFLCTAIVMFIIAGIVTTRIPYRKFGSACKALGYKNARLLMPSDLHSSESDLNSLWSPISQEIAQDRLTLATGLDTYRGSSRKSQLQGSLVSKRGLRQEFTSPSATWPDASYNDQRQLLPPGAGDKCTEEDKRVYHEIENKTWWKEFFLWAGAFFAICSVLCGLAALYTIAVTPWFQRWLAHSSESEPFQDATMA
mmetsp:Transcript_12244/g.22724  ORF Transcript_12244/g.22724 Transcript_12244/m.22724 type:complete len:930 (-) Transcript_12244:70-2859(-)